MYPDLSAMSLEDVDSVSEIDRDTLAPLPPPWNNHYPFHAYPPHMAQFASHTYATLDASNGMSGFVDGAAAALGVGSSLAAGGNCSCDSGHSASGKGAVRRCVMPRSTVL